MRNIFYKATKTAEHIKTEKVKVNFTLQKKGFINLIGTKRGKRTAYHASVSVKKGIAKVKTFATKKGLKLYQIADQIKTKAIKAKKLAGAFIKGARLEAKILTAKFEFNRALRSLESSYFVATKYLAVINAYFQLRTFKSSLPQYIRVNLF